MDYLFVLKALQDIPFGVGRKLLMEFLQGSSKHESIKRNRLDKLESFGSLAYGTDELSSLIDGLVMNDFIKQVAVKGNAFVKVYELSSKGQQEIKDPSFYKRKLAYLSKESMPTAITEQDKALFSALGDYLSKYTDEQKKAITCNNDKILCIAGAGSGKTTVLIKRIQFLIQYRSANPSKILAITFTRKARQEMKTRLDKLGLGEQVHIETFNSFCEKQLIHHNDLVYGRMVHTMSYRDRFRIMQKALHSAKYTMDKALQVYFSQSQMRLKTPEQLAIIFMNDCFFIRDYFASKKQNIEPSLFTDFDFKHKNTIDLIISICSHINLFMEQEGLRDFADQLLDTLSLFEGHKGLIPSFEHILVDEYQDVNATQMHLLRLLNAPNLFCVGDPRQSIYGWRGSDIRYILQFEEMFPACEIISLTKNYRSSSYIVSLINHAIAPMGLLDLESAVDSKKDIQLHPFHSDSEEFSFVIDRILNASIAREEIFVLARTNRYLLELSQLLKIKKIPHVLRSEELGKALFAKEGEITLSTIHAAKGMEADMVFVVGSSVSNFPCKGSEHPIIDLIKVEEYDKEEEERRLFYVALSRARTHLYVTYTGSKPTYFISEKMMKLFEGEKSANGALKSVAVDPVLSSGKKDALTRLKEWRSSVSKELGIPAYLIFHDKTLIELVQKQPMSVFDLQEVNGFGPTKISKYGESVLDVLHR